MSEGGPGQKKVTLRKIHGQLNRKSSEKGKGKLNATGNISPYIPELPTTFFHTPSALILHQSDSIQV